MKQHGRIITAASVGATLIEGARGGISHSGLPGAAGRLMRRHGAGGAPVVRVQA